MARSRATSSTFFDSSSCSRKLPAVWKNFFGTIGARSRTSASGARSAVSSAPPRSKYSRIVGDVEAHDLLAVDAPDLAVVVGDELHAHPADLSCATSA